MHFPLLIAFAALLTVVSGLIMPDVEDGFYMSYTNGDGVDVHIKLAEPNNTGFTNGIAPPMSQNFPRNLPQVEPRSKIDKRYSGCSFCGCGFNMDHGNCDAANADLVNQVNAVGGVFVNQRGCWYSIRSDSVAFACNPYPSSGYSTDEFWGSDVGSSDAVITGDCGWYVAGTYAWGYEVALVVGYMQYTPGLDFLDAAMGSNARGC